MFNTKNQEYFILKIVARILILIWAGFWLWFAIMSSIAEKMVADLLFIGVIVLIPAIVVFMWEGIGAWFIFIIGLIIAAGYPIMFSGLNTTMKIGTDLMLSFCPLTAGILLIIRQMKLKKLRKVEASSSQ